MRSGSFERARSVSVNCGHASHAFFFPIPTKNDVVSQHVKLWNRGRAFVEQVGGNCMDRNRLEFFAGCEANP